MRDPAWRARTIEQPVLALDPIPPRPLAGTTHTDLSSRCRLRQRPTLIDNSPRELPAPIQTERRVSVKLHPVSSLRLSCLAALRLQGGPDGPTYSGTTSSSPRAGRCLCQTRAMALTGEPVTGAAADPLAAGQAGARFVRGGTLRVAAYALAISTSIVAMPFVTRHLHSGNYGRYVVVTSVMVIVAALTEGGIANLGVREYSQSPDPQRREFMRSLIGMRIALSALGAAGAIVFTVAAGFSPVVVEGTAIAGAGLVLAGLQITLTVPLTAALRLGWLAALDVITPGATALTLIVLVVLGAPLLPFYLSTVIAYGASLAVTAALVRHEVTLRPAFNLARWRSLLGDSAVVAAATAIGVVYFQVVVVVMALITNAQQTGIFSVAFRILSVVNGIPVVLVGSAFPILLRAAGDDRVRLRFVLGRLLEGSLLLGGWLSLLV